MEGGLLALGTEAVEILCSSLSIANDKWKNYSNSEDEADQLAKIVNNGTLLLGYLNPEVKGRLIDKLCHSSWNPLDNNDNKELAILRVLNTVASQREFQEIKEHMGPPDHSDINRAEDKLNAILNHQYKTDYENWQKSLPDVAPRLLS